MANRPPKPNLAVLFFLVTSGLFLIFAAVQNPGYLDATDAEARLSVVTALMDRGEVNVSLRVKPDVTGPVKYTITSAIAAWPFVSLGRMIQPGLTSTAAEIRDAQWFVLGHSLFIALTGGILFLFAHALGAPLRRALGLGLAVCLTTYLFQYGRSAQAEGFAALLLLATAWGAWWHAGRPGMLRAMATGLPFGLLLSTKIELGVCFPAIAAHVAWAAWRRGAPSNRSDWHGTLRSLIGLGLGTLPGVAWIAVWNWMRYGNPLSTGYGKIRMEGEGDGAFSTPLFYGLWMSLLSPGKSVFLYAPILALAIGGWLRGLGARGRGLGWLVLGMVVAVFILYAMWFSPVGGTAIGARFHVVAIPLACVGLLGLWRGRASLTRPLRWSLGAALVTGALVQIAFLGTSFIWHYDATLPPEPPFAPRKAAHERLMADWRLSPIAAAVSDAVQGYGDLRWASARPLSEAPVVHYMLPALLTAGALLLLTANALIPGHSNQRPPSTRYIIPGLTLLALGPLWVFAIVAKWGSYPLLQARDRVTNQTIWLEQVRGIQRDNLGRSRTLVFGHKQHPNSMKISGRLLAREGHYDFRWVTDTPGRIILGGQCVAIRDDWSTATSVHRFSAQLPKGFTSFTIQLDDMNWTRRGILRLEWGRNGRRLEPIPISVVYGP